MELNLSGSSKRKTKPALEGFNSLSLALSLVKLFKNNDLADFLDCCL
jgi:hypothetical protein